MKKDKNEFRFLIMIIIMFIISLVYNIMINIEAYALDVCKQPVKEWKYEASVSFWDDKVLDFKNQEEMGDFMQYIDNIVPANMKELKHCSKIYDSFVKQAKAKKINLPECEFKNPPYSNVQGHFETKWEDNQIVFSSWEYMESFFNNFMLVINASNNYYKCVNNYIAHFILLSY